MSRILLLGSGTQAYAILKPLRNAGHELFVLVSHPGNYADVSKYVSKRIVIPFSTDNPEYLSTVKKIIETERIEVLIPMGDASAEFLSKYRTEFLNQASFIVPEYGSFMQGYDKNMLMSLCRKKGYPHPLTVDLSNVRDIYSAELTDFPYPGFLKPNCTTGGRGMRIISSHEELKKIYPDNRTHYGECHLQKYIPKGGRQVKVQLFVDENSNLLYSSVLDKVRWYPIAGGSSCCCVSIMEEKMVGICSQVLKDIGWVGFADFDLIENPDTHELLIMEINPRLPACIGCAVAAGINWGEIIVDASLGLPLKQYDYRLGVSFRHLGFDMLWFLKSPKRFSAKPSWFHFFGKSVYYQDFDFIDQKPFWVGTFNNLKKMFSPSFKSSKTIV